MKDLEQDIREHIDVPALFELKMQTEIEIMPRCNRLILDDEL